MLVEGQPSVKVYEYNTPGQYFGELSLISNKPRAANVVASGPCTCVTLDRASFTRLLGPLHEVLMENKSVYVEMEQKLQNNPRNAFKA